MLTEDYCGICPKCKYARMLIRYGSDGYFQFDACPNCGFAYGELFDEKDGRISITDEAVWAKIEEHYKKTRPEILKWINSWKPPSPGPTSVFVHTEEIENRLNLEKKGDEKNGERK